MGEICLTETQAGASERDPSVRSSADGGAEKMIFMQEVFWKPVQF